MLGRDWETVQSSNSTLSGLDHQPLAGPSKPRSNSRHVQLSPLFETQQTSTSPRLNDSPTEAEVEPSDDGHEPKRRKIRRSKQACFPCRTRKRKCGGRAPQPCPTCIEDEHECTWPQEDGRSSSAKKEKARVKSALAPAVVELPTSSDGSWGANDDRWLNFLGDLTFDSQVVTQPISDVHADFFNLDVTAPPPALPLTDEGTSFDPQLGLPPDWTSMLDPHQFVLALSSRLPMVEQNSVEDTSPSSDVSGDRTLARTRAQRHGTTVKITWWRPHGQTAIAPGLKKMTLRVRLDNPTSRTPEVPKTLQNPIDLFDEDRAPNLSIMRPLLLIFKEHFGSQIPALDIDRMLKDLENGQGSVFLLNCIAATVGRFSSDPSLGGKIHERGNVFGRVAKDMLGAILSVPSRETVIALLLLCHVGFGNDSEAEEWMFAGMAVRMSIDLGLHLDPGDECEISSEERRLNRLVFWVDEITQALPTEDDLASPTCTRHPFPHAVKQMYSYGRLIELLNSRKTNTDSNIQQDIQRCRLAAIKEYSHLPPDLHWNVTNLQRQSVAGHAPIYLQLHLWMHTIIASGYLTGTDYLRRDHGRVSRSGAATPNLTAATNMWRHSARTIGDIFVLCDIICPMALVALPFVNQAFYVAGSCYAKELETERERLTSSGNRPDADDAGNSAELFKAILTTVSTENISTLRRGLAKQAQYWSGVAWVAEALEQRIQGIGVGEIDLVSVTEKLNSVTSVPDAGLLHPSTGEVRVEQAKNVGSVGIIAN